MLSTLSTVKLPEHLIWSRMIAGIVILASSLFLFNKVFILIVFIYGFLSDIFDGVIARKLKVSTMTLRRLDGNIDTFFYVCSFIALFMHNWNIIIHGFLWVLIIIGLKIIRYVYDYIKFCKEMSYHMYTAKLWGVLLFLFYIDLLFNGRLGVIFTIVVIVGLLTNFEALITSMLLKNWEHDIPSIITIIKRASTGKIRN
jgi:phosphatidylglycerophosphate synthase